MAPKKSSGKSSVTPTRQSARTITPPQRFAPTIRIVSRANDSRVRAGRRMVRSISAPIPPDRMASPVAMPEHAHTEASSMSTTPSVITPSDAGSPVEIDFTFDIQTGSESTLNTPEAADHTQFQVSPLDHVFLGYVDSDSNSSVSPSMQDDSIVEYTQGSTENDNSIGHSDEMTENDNSIGQYSPELTENNHLFAESALSVLGDSETSLPYLDVDDAFDEFSVEGQARNLLRGDFPPEAPVRIYSPTLD